MSTSNGIPARRRLGAELLRYSFSSLGPPTQVPRAVGGVPHFRHMYLALLTPIPLTKQPFLRGGARKFPICHTSRFAYHPWGDIELT